MDKLTQAVTVKLSPETTRAAKLVGESMGYELSEYIRHLVTTDLDRAKGQYVALHQVFGQPMAASTFTKGDTV